MDAQSVFEKASENGIYLYVESEKLKYKAKNGALTDELSSLIKQYKSELIALLDEGAGGTNAFLAGAIPLARKNRGVAKLSFTQQRLWFLDRLNGSSAEYNMPMALHVEGAFDLIAAELALGRIIRRHESLRTIFREEDEGPVQIIQDYTTFKISCRDISALSPQERKKELRNLIQQDALRTFDISRDLLIRCSYIKTSEEEGCLLFNIHHIASDGWSMDILNREFIVQYKSAKNSEPDPLPPLPIQYADYAHWQREFFQEESIKSQYEYWDRHLESIAPENTLPLDFPRPEHKSFEGDIIRCRLSAELGNSLESLARRFNLTTFMLVHAALCLVLSRHKNNHDIVIGTTVANRQRPETQDLVGFFVNTLVLRANTDFSTLPDYLENIRQINILAQKNQDVSFDQLVERLRVERSTARSPLFQIMLSMATAQGKASGSDHTIADTRFSRVEDEEVFAKFDLSVDLAVLDDGLLLSWTFDKSLFTRSHIQQLSGHMQCLLENMVRQPAASLSELEMLPSRERHYLIQELNETRRDYSADKQIHELFEARVRQTPEQVAVQFESTGLTYRQLNERANQLAGYLRQQGVGADSLVGLALERSADMVVAIVAVLKAGGAYVPLDPDYPFARIEYMAGEARVSLVLTQSHLVEQYRALVNVNLVELDSAGFKAQVEGFNTENLPRLPVQGPTNLAYVIYTSGSTGTPKGVMVSHRALVNRIEWMQNAYQLNAQDRVLQKTPFSFDVSVWEFLWPLCYGATLVVARPAGHKDPDYLSELIGEKSVTVMHFVPSMLELYLKHEQSRFGQQVRYVFCSGEALTANQVSEFHRQASHVQLHNLYGPTEAAIDVTYYHCRQGDSSYSVPIGRPIQNIALFVLDMAMRLCPAGAEGELYIGGVGLARGYLNRPDLTAERFVEHPFSPGEKLYKTGDLVRYRADGNLEYLGRLDDQVKLRGFRIELGEITAQLNACAEVDSGLAKVCQSPSGDAQLVAYVVPAQSGLDEQQLEDVLRSRLQDTLPEYMVPSAFVVLEAFPLTANGKINYKALPEPGCALRAGKYLPPRTETEIVLSDVWRELLKIESAGKADNFFRLGGHSILVIKMLSRLREKGYSIELKEVYGAADLAAMAAKIDRLRTAKSPVESKPGIPQGCTAITADMLDLVRLDSGDLDYIVSRVPGGAENIEDIFPLSHLQEGILFHHLMDREDDPYILLSMLKVKGDKAYRELIDGLNFIIARHEMLRTAVFWQGITKPVQVVMRAAQLAVEVITVQSGDSALAQLERHVRRQRIALEQAPLIKLYATQSNDQYDVILAYHHIVTDHLVLEILSDELQLYRLGLTGKLATPAPYRQFVERVRDQSVAGHALPFFRGMLEDVSEATTPLGLTDIQGNTEIAEVVEFVPGKTAASIRAISQRMSCSPAVLFHTVFSMVVSSLCGRDDVVFGTVLSGRQQGIDGIDKAVGLFINTLPIRVKLDNRRLSEVYTGIRNILVELVAHEQTSLVTAQRCSGVPKDAPLFTSILNYRHAAPALLSDNEAEGELNDIEIIDSRERTNYPLSLGVSDIDGEFELNLKTAAKAEAGAILAHIQEVLDVVVEALDTGNDVEISDLKAKVPTPRFASLQQEREVSTNRYDALSKVLQQKRETIHYRFEQAALDKAGDTALVFESHQLTFSELNAQANRLAHYLAEHISPDGKRVGICLPRSIDLVVAILAALKSGAAYVPIDTSLPDSRKKFIAIDAELSAVITCSSQVSAFPGQTRLCLDDIALQETLSNYVEDNLHISAKGDEAEALAYIIYTSGTTGTPKGVMVSHSCVDSFYHGFREQLAQLNLTDDAPWLWNASYAFDASIKGLVSLIAGRKVVLASDEQSRDPAALVALMKHTGVNVFNSVPRMVSQVIDVLEHEPDFAVNLISSGEDITQDTWERIGRYCSRHGKKAINAYGPTEATVNACYAVIACGQPVNIGKPLINAACFVLDENLSEVRPGSAGELFIGGPCVALGYLNRDRLTSENFIENRIRPDVSAFLYRTGDKVKQLSDGRLVFLGRDDSQIKHRGYRIELGEVEHALKGLADVEDAVATLTDTAVGKQLTAYFVPRGNATDTDPEAVRAALESALPQYMVPDAFVILTELPLTVSGKVDRGALPIPQALAESGAKGQPRDEIEKTLCDILSSVLNISVVGIHDNFFHLGGDSILSMQVVARAKRNNIFISVRDVFTAKTVASLAEIARKAERQQAIVEDAKGEQVLLPIQRDFLLSSLGARNHFNQSLLITVPPGLTRPRVRQLAHALLKRHDVFRLAFKTDAPDKWRAFYKDLDRDLLGEIFHYHNLADTAEEERKQTIQNVGSRYQQSFDLENGGLFRLVYFDFGQEEEGRLLLIAHHLVIDGVSWRILVSDLQLGCQQLIKGETLSLPPRTSSYQTWAEFLEGYATTGKFARQIEFWEAQVATDVPDLFPGAPAIAATTPLAKRKSVTVELEAGESSYLLKAAPQALNADINEILLTGLFLAVRKRTGIDRCRFLMEGHGREPLEESPDISETIGWFTSKFPFYVSSTHEELDSLISSVKQQYRSLPDKGLGYGLVKHFVATTDIRAEPFAQLLFNYLGSVDQIFASSALLSLADEAYGDDVGEDYVPPHALSVDSMVLDKKFKVSLRFCTNRYREEDILAFGRDFINELRRIIMHSKNRYTERDLYARLGLDIEPAVLDRIAIKLNESESGFIVFGMPPVSGSSLVYQPLAKQLENSAQFYGLQLPDLYTDITTTSIEGLASFYISIIKRIQPAGPYRLLGWSSGGTVAYEIGRQFEKAGDNVAFLGILDQPYRVSGAQEDLYRENPYFKIEGLYQEDLEFDWESIRGQSEQKAIQRLVKAINQQGLKPEGVEDDVVNRHLQALITFPQVMDQYEPVSSSLDIELFRTNVNQVNPSPYLDWDKVTGGKINVMPAEGEHMDMVYEKYAGSLAAKIISRLNPIVVSPAEIEQ